MTTHSRCYMSFGGGIQSTALAFLAVNRDPRLLAVSDGLVPEVYLFADTGDERTKTYDHVWRMAHVIERHGFELHTVHRGAESLSEHVLNRASTGERGISMPPVFVETSTGKHAPARRGCTQDFKVKPLDRYAKRHFSDAIANGDVVQQWYGISRDEAARMRDCADKWRTFFYPLVLMGWSRWHCERYLAGQTYLDGRPVEVVRSSCVFCPFHDLEEWRSVRSDSHEWEKARAFESRLMAAHDTHGSVAGLKSRPYLTRVGVMLDDLDLEEVDDGQLHLWDNECLGVCGV
jgi:hypothetical protein